MQRHPVQVTPDYRTSTTQDSKSAIFQTAGGEMKWIGKDSFPNGKL